MKIETSRNFKFEIGDGEYWYGLCARHGRQYPLSKNSDYSHDFRWNFTANQEAPLMLSSDGKYIWSEEPFKVTVKDGVLEIEGKEDIEYCEGLSSLREAFLAVSAKHFPANGEYPPEDFIIKPQYNTWIELIYDQNQKDILKYAHDILDNGLPAGIIMIDDNWNRYYGCWEFRKEAFPDPRAMCDELHSMGFSVMLWVCPFISPDSAEFRETRAKGLLVRDKDGRVVIREWWNGYSAILDLSNPDAEKWFCEKIDRLINEYGIDGVKLDAGDAQYYRDDDKTFGNVSAHTQTELWAKLGLKYRFNEFRACFKAAGLPLVQRLHDKLHNWPEGVVPLIPDSLSQGILGYAFSCPDMIGGGAYTEFLPGSLNLDEELFVRYAQCSALLPMMQYSAAPWRILSAENAQYCIEAGKLHERFSGEILELVKHAAKTGEPIVRYMEYSFPHQGMAGITDQFMLGDRVLVAPVIEKGATTRTVTLPTGKWKYCDGTVYDGNTTVIVPAPINTLPYFELA